ncbi:MAG: hypothetical protein DCC56_14645 [Anaerolineae bacterium]|nr:MAG: hypothetical protein DCC56_14645 [Anaerolineae bacterium]WKZ42564.1 MAG: trypsin-like peptidase domain-containing protein [Anaerolineales bacterium]
MTQPEASILRVLKNNSVVGAAFLGANGIAVTCAHVIKAAGKTKGDLVTLKSANGEPINAVVISEFWRDVKAEDVAMLRIEESVLETLPLVFGSSEGTKGHVFSTFGFPQPSQQLMGRGEIVGYAYLNDIKLIQLRSEQVTPGFSGAPVFDENTQRVVGMIVAITPPDEYKRQGTTAFAIPSETIREICPELQVWDICPYLGLEAFTEETEEFFFGREALTKKLLSVLGEGCRFLAVFGPSGSGKSSVVRAGLLPALKNGQLSGSEKWVQITMRPADNPFEQIIAAGLDPTDISAYFKSHAGVQRILLFIDQLEELFTLCPDDVRERFTHDLATALENSRLIVILSMRDDFYSAFNSKAAPLAESDHLKIENVPGALKGDELIAMIERPAERVGLALEEGLIGLIIKDLTRDGEARSATLPLLEFALRQLWEKRRDGVLMHNTYQAIGGVTGSLARWADDAYSDLPKQDQTLAESLLTSLVHLGEEAQGLPDTRRRRTLAEFNQSTRRVTKYFTDKRLLVTSGETVELVHDALVREWGRLRSWLVDNRRFLYWRQKMDAKLQEWEKGDGELLRGRELAEAQGILKERRNDVLELSEYIRLSVSRQRRQRNIFIGIISTLLVVFGFLAFWGQGNAQDARNQAATAQANADAAATAQANAEQQAKVSRAGDLALFAISRLQNEPDLSLLIAIEANKVVQKPETEEALRLSLLESRLITEIKGHNGAVWNATYSPNGLYFVTTSTDKTAQVWDAKTYQPIGSPLPHEHFVERAAISQLCPDKQQYVLTASRDGTTIIWDLLSSKLIRQISNISPGWETYGVAISPDCKYIATANEHGMAILWDFAGNDLRIYYTGEDQIINTVEFSPDGKFILAASNDNNAYVWDVVANNKVVLEPKLKLVGHSGPVLSAAYSRSGAYIVTASQDKTARVWKVENGELFGELRGHTNEVWSADFSPDVNFIVTTSSDGSVRLWSTFIGVQIAEFRGHKGAVYSAEFSPDGKYLLTSSEDKTARVWEASRAIGNFYFHGNWLNDVDFSPDNKIFVTAGRDNKAIIWNIADHNLSVFTEGPYNLEKYLKITSQNLATELLHEDSVNSISFSPNGKFLVTSSGTEAIIWDVKTGNTIRKLIGHTEAINSAKYSPNGELLLTSSRYPDNTARIWNANTGELLTSYYGPDLLGGINDASFSPDGKYIVIAVNDGIASVWQVDTKKAEITSPVIELKGHTQAVLSAIYSHSGRYILTSGDNTARIWNANTGQIISILRGHKDVVYNASFDPKDQFVVTAGGDYRAIVWDSSTGKQLTELRDHAGPVVDAVFSPDGKYIVTASQDNIARLFSCDMCGSFEELLALAKARAPRELTCEERQIYLQENIACLTPTP